MITRFLFNISAIIIANIMDFIKIYITQFIGMPENSKTTLFNMNIYSRPKTHLRTCIVWY